MSISVQNESPPLRLDASGAYRIGDSRGTDAAVDSTILMIKVVRGVARTDLIINNLIINFKICVLADENDE